MSLKRNLIFFTYFLKILKIIKNFKIKKMNNDTNFFNKNQIIIGIAIGVIITGIICLIGFVIAPKFNKLLPEITTTPATTPASSTPSPVEKSLLVRTAESSSTKENYDNLDQIPPNESKDIQKIQKFLSDFLNIYCNIKDEGTLKTKSEVLLLKMYNFIKMKKEKDVFFGEVKNDDTTEFRSLTSGKKKGDKLPYNMYITKVLDLLVYIFMISKFKNEDKKEMLSSLFILMFSLSGSKTDIKYNSSDNTFDIEDGPFKTNYKTPNKMSYNDFRDLLYTLVEEIFSNIKIIDDDLINFDICS